MGRILSVMFISVFVASTTTGCVKTASPGFSESFNTFDQRLWIRGQHQLGRSEIDPANATVADGLLRLAVPAGKTDGGELRTRSTYGYGSYRSKIKTAGAPSSVTAFFLYVPPDNASEIDIEIYNNPEGTVRLSTYSGGALTHTEEQVLPFDPTLKPHEYRIDYGPGAVSFYVDGSMIRSWSDGTPTQPMNLYLNVWFPTWLPSVVSGYRHAALVDSVEYRESQ